MASIQPEPPLAASSLVNGRYVRIACVYSVIVVAVAILTLALTPTSPNRNLFKPRIVARLGGFDEDFGTGTSCCGMSECAPPKQERTIELIEEFSPVEHRDPLRDIEPVRGGEESTLPLPPYNSEVWPLRRRRLANDRNTATGPSDQSDGAVDAALAWLALHQRPDGSWSFDHRDGPCAGRCRHHGESAAAKNAATGVVLLTFLGAGETHLEGRYQHTVDAGLRYLAASQQKAGTAGSWHDGFRGSGIYSHAIATAATCEALQAAQLSPLRPSPPKPLYSMTEAERRQWQEAAERAARRPAEAIGQEQLRRVAEAGVNYLLDTQHKSGGWQGDKADTPTTFLTTTALSALGSGRFARFKVPTASVVAASKFLDTVQDEDDASRFFNTPARRQAIDQTQSTSAVGLLARIILGWDRQHPGIVAGAERISRRRPATGQTSNILYNYYATQVMYFHGGDDWSKWNVAMRDYLVDAQSKQDHEHGSWYFGKPSSTTPGGRLFDTTLAAMTLQIYYRHPSGRNSYRERPMCGVGGAASDRNVSAERSMPRQWP